MSISKEYVAMDFQVGNGADQKLSVGPIEDLGLDQLSFTGRNLINTEGKGIGMKIEELKQELKDIPYGSAKLLNNSEISCVITGQEHDILNYIKVMKYAQIISLSGSLGDNDRKILDAFYQEKVSEILSISSSLTKMKINANHCNDDSFQATKNILQLNLNNTEQEKELIEDAIQQDNKSICYSNFEESVATAIENTNIANLAVAENASELLEDAYLNAIAGVIMTSGQNDKFGFSCYSENIETSQHDGI